ncbi:MAG: cation-translocating P-type ATPase [Syntrophobacteraceae bacterium]
MKLFGIRKLPLLGCEVVHSLPGRMRIRCPAFRYFDEQKTEIQERLESSEEIKSALVSTITENVLVCFDEQTATRESILETTESVIGSFSMIAYKAERKEKMHTTVNERRLQEEPISEMLTRVTVTTLSLIISFLSGTKPQSGIFLRRFVTMPALTSLSLAIPIFKSGLKSLRTSHRPNADTLSSAAIMASLLAGRDMSALTIIWLADIAELLTAYTMERTRKAISDILSIGEEFVWRINDDGLEEKVALEYLRQGDRIMVHTGEKISVDGVVESGEAAVDQASMTGEFLPVTKTKDDKVFAGTVVRSRRLVIRAEKVGDETAVARIIHMVEEATYRKADIQATADRFSANFIPLNFALAAIVLVVTKSVTRALNMLIIDYSCGVRLSTATALSAAIGNSARNGILIKGGNFIEMLDKADTLILDKTGTLTEGKAQVISIVPLDGRMTDRKIIELAAASEESSTHPMAVAILDKVKRSGWRVPKHADTKVHVARGVETKVGGKTIRVGNLKFMEENGIDAQGAHENMTRLVRRGENVVYVARDKILVGILGIQDMLRENMKKALNRLRYSGIDDIILLTGDVEQHAEIVASRMAMDRYMAEVLPDDKAETVLRLQSKGVTVVMVGDGVNDAPALAYADVGIAMGGTRTDVAIEASDITITNDDPLMIPATIRLAKNAMDIVRQNFAISISVNTVGLLLSSLGVLPVFWGAVLHNATTVAVVLNSGRLLFFDLEKGK